MAVSALMHSIAIRPYRVSDAHDVYAAISESIEQMSRWMPWCQSSYTVHDALNWLVEQESCRDRGTAYEFAITGPDGGYLGGCGINQVNREYRLANLGYWVRSSATGRGIAAHAVELVTQWTFANTDLLRLELVIAVDNQRSIRVAEKVGAVYEGVARSRLLLRQQPTDALMYSIIRADVAGGISGY
ncbi:MAG: GNAT family N-acetyltransferase [Gammaproteobacteria bacterium]|nr:GNAT family N-acetyltransferase [Gammaproteobacteria bacterium]